MKPHGRLASIDCLRGVAVLLVLMHHVFRMSFPEKSLFWIPEWINNYNPGVRGVALFFVISGFCIHLPWARQKALAATGTPHVDFLPFWKRRLWRLYPPYFIALTGGMLLVLLIAAIGRYGAVTPDYYPGYRGQFALDYVLHALMLHGFFPTYDGAGSNPPFWTLAREEYLYLLYFALLFWRTRWNPWLSTFLAFVAGAGLWIVAATLTGQRGDGWAIVRDSAIVLWVQWALGMLAVESAFGLVRLPAWTRQLWLVPAWVAASWYVEGHARILSPVSWGMACFTLVNWATSRELAGRWPARGAGWLRYTGVISYSIYLTHWPSVWAAFIVIRGVFGRGALTPNKPEYVAQLMFLTTVGYGVGWMYSRLVERHFLNRPDSGPSRELRPAFKGSGVFDVT